jgi:hypothetical protein
MDRKSFEEIIRTNGATANRRRFGSMLAALGLGTVTGLSLLGRDEAAAKKKKRGKARIKKQSTKAVVCHDGKTTKISKKTLHAHLAHGDTLGVCPPAPSTKIDAVCPGPVNDAFGIIDVSARLAQTFSAIASGPLVKAELRLIKAPASAGNYVLRLSPLDGAGVPTNIVLAEATVADASVPDGQSTVTFSFASPAAVAVGTSYALVVTRPGSDKLAWAGQTGNSCAGTAYMSPSPAGAFVAVGNIDLNFTTYVTS